jgi:MarR family transcriptional regulator, negative regulator of the multidrug operon emrRAB
MPARVDNTLGALAVALVDGVQAAVDGEGATASAALVTLYFEPGTSIEQLRRALAITHSGGVRLVDRLAGAGLVERRQGVGRRVALVLTAAGRRAARRALSGRRGVIERALAALTPAEHDQLDALVGKMLGALVEDDDDAWRICRLCDVDSCTNPECPVERALENP